MQSKETKKNGQTQHRKQRELDAGVEVLEAKAVIDAEKIQRETACLNAIKEQCELFRCRVGSEPAFSGGLIVARIVVTALD